MGKAKRQAEKAAKAVLGVKVGKTRAIKAAAAPVQDRATGKGTAKRKESGLAQGGALGGQPEAKQRVKSKPLILCARGITYRYRHLMTDLMQLVPHHKSDSKLDTKHDWQAINEIAELKSATSVLFFEARKRQDLYVWLARPHSGPTVRFLASNVHTMAELKLSGNHLRGSRPALAFDAAFDEQPHLQIMKELLQQVFVTPRGHQKAKPFFDHVISFSWADNRVWLRNHQVVPAPDKKAARSEGISLVEVGPRVTLQPIKVFEGSFRGRVLFENPEFITPNAVRAYERRAAAGGYDARKAAAARREAHHAANRIEPAPLDDRIVFARAEGTTVQVADGETGRSGEVEGDGGEAGDESGKVGGKGRKARRALTR